MKYESGETFESMSLRYSIVLNLLNYSDIKISTPKLTDGQLIDRLRKSAYSEATERLLILYSYGMIDEKLLRTLVLGKQITCRDATEAENLVLSLEKSETEKYIEVNAEMLDLNAFVNALLMCAAVTSSELLVDINFTEAYNICSAEHKHIHICDGYCFPDKYIFEFISSFEGLVAKYSKISDCVKEADTDELTRLIENDTDESVVFKDMNIAVFVERYIEKLFGRDYIEYCINSNLPMTIDDEKYLEYLKDKKLSFEFTKYERKHWYFTSKYNHLDYDIIKTENGNLTSIKEDVNEVVMLRIDASEVGYSDTPKDIIVKILKHNVDTFPAEGTIMQTVYEGKEMIFAYSKGKYTEIDYNLFKINLVDFQRILDLVKLFSEKHLIRLTGEANNIEIIASKGGIDYRQEKNINDDEFEAIKGVIREQLARRFALERKKTDGLRSMSQLKIEAETAKREEAMAKAQAEEERKNRIEEEHAKRAGRKKAGQE